MKQKPPMARNDALMIMALMLGVFVVIVLSFHGLVHFLDEWGVIHWLFRK